MSRIIATFLFCLVVIGLVACGGGSSTPPPTPTPALVVSPSSAQVVIGGSQNFTASVTGVTWNLSGPGTINQNGVYLAPSTFPGSGTNTAMITADGAGLTGKATATVVFPNNNAGNQGVPIKLGTSGGNVNDNSTDGKECCIGTLGSLLNRGGTLFILSNNHVLARSTLANTGELIDQPGQAGCPPGSQGLNVGSLSQQAALKPATSPGLAPSNVDAAIAQIVNTTVVDSAGSILDLGTAGSTSIGDAPPSSSPITPSAALAAGAHVAKSGRTTGLTCSTIQAISVDNVSVDYDQSCGGPLAFTAIFNGQVAVAGGSFSANGDSGSLIVTTDTAAPLALLFAGNSTSTIGNPILDSTDSKGNLAKGVLTAFNNGTVPTIVGGAPHGVSCEPTAQVQSAQVGAQSAAISAQQRQIAAGVHDRHATELMSLDPAVRSVTVGASADAPGEGAVVLHLSGIPNTGMPAVVEGVRTQLVYEEGVTAPRLTTAEMNRGLAAKDNHREQFMQHGFQGVGVGRSDDAPGEAAVVIYTIKGEAHAPIPAILDGVRTKIIEGERFRASRWNSQLEPKRGSCSKPKTKQRSKIMK